VKETGLRQAMIMWVVRLPNLLESRKWSSRLNFLSLRHRAARPGVSRADMEDIEFGKVKHGLIQRITDTMKKKH
jgi:hypothetical protein